jgi:hypothetical protein
MIAQPYYSPFFVFNSPPPRLIRSLADLYVQQFTGIPSSCASGQGYFFFRPPPFLAT